MICILYKNFLYFRMVLYFYQACSWLFEEDRFKHRTRFDKDIKPSTKNWKVQVTYENQKLKLREGKNNWFWSWCKYHYFWSAWNLKTYVVILLLHVSYSFDMLFPFLSCFILYPGFGILFAEFKMLSKSIKPNRKNRLKSAGPCLPEAPRLRE